MNPLYAELPDSVEVNGKKYKVKTDFRDWIRFADVCADYELRPEEKLVLLYEVFEDGGPRDFLKGLEALFGFFTASELPRTGRNRSGGGTKAKKGERPVFSYYYDSAYILGSFLQAYGIDLRESEYMHWYKFRCLMDALPGKSTLKERVAYRAINPNDIKDNHERGRIRKLQAELEIPMESNALTDADIGEIFGSL